MANDKGDASTAENGEILEPVTGGVGPSPEILAHFGDHYTERPDLLIEALEKYDPGFVARMNSNAEEGAKQFRESRFKFGRSQAYSSLLIQIIAAIAVLFMAVYLVVSEQASFGNLIACAAFFAVTQGGRSGFLEIAKGLAGLLSGRNKDLD